MGSSMRGFCYAWITGLIFLFLTGCAPTTGSTPGDVALLSDALAATGAKPQKLVVGAWTLLPGGEPTDGQLVAIVEAAIGKLGVERGGYDIRHGRSERHRFVRAESVKKGQTVYAVAQVVYPAWGDNVPEVYLAVNVETTTKPTEIAAWRSKVTAAASGGGSPRISTCLIGWLDGKLKKDEWPNKLHSAEQVLGASVFDRLEQANFASVVGFSPRLPDIVLVGDKRVNVNLAIRFSSIDNRTYVIVASPVITGEY